MAQGTDPLALSLIVDLPPGVTEAQAKQLASAMRKSLVEFGRALDIPGEQFKVNSVSGPAEPQRLSEVREGKTLPGVVLKHRGV